jgi:cysteine desulfurase/selenocysteine lyase
MFDIQKIRADFPILSRQVNGKPLVYFDNGATTQKPQVVIDAIATYYQEINANIHRGVHTLSQLATDAYEASRTKIQNHINAQFAHEVLFTSGTTHGVNLVANGFASLLKSGDEVLVSALEHHSNIVPWQMLCEKTGAVLKVIPMNEKGELVMTEFDQLLSDKTKIVTVNHISNALGTINPIKYMIDKAHQFGAAVFIDGAQAVPHLKPNVQELDCDFYAFSGHKICGPTGTGILYGKEAWLNKLPPYQGAGTPNIAGGIVLGTAVDYMNSVGFDNIQKQELELLNYATEQLLAIEGLKIYGTAEEKTSVISFNIDGIHPYDIGTIVDKLGIAVRTGHHCAQPIMNFFEIPGTIRASFAFYNTKEEIDSMVEAVKRAKMMLS